MSFKYIDPGYGWGFSQPVGVSQSKVHNPIHGVAFYSFFESADSLRPTTLDTVITAFWMKFDIFLPEQGYASSRIVNYGEDILQIEQSGTEFIIHVMEDDSLELEGTATNLKANSVNTIWLHVETGDSEWYMTLAVNEKNVLDNASTSEYFGSTRNSFGFYVSSTQPVSNLIISDEEIALKETIVEVGNYGVETTMTENDGAYSSAQAGDYVLQILDTSTLYGLFGSDSKVTAAVAIAAPTYTTGEDVEHIRCRIVNGETVTDYPIYNNEFPGYELSLQLANEEDLANPEDWNYIPFMAKQLDVASDTTFASLNGLKVGWVTA